MGINSDMVLFLVLVLWQSHRYHRTPVGSHVWSIISSDLVGPLTQFQGHGIFKVVYLKNGASYGQGCYSTLIGNHT